MQIISAGTGHTHSEYNESKNETRLFQIWIEPNLNDIKPRRETVVVNKKQSQLNLLASGRIEDMHDNVPRIYQDVGLFSAFLKADEKIDYKLQINRQAYLLVVSGELEISQEKLYSSDACYIKDEHEFTIESKQESHFIFLDFCQTSK